jgi:hypothetical protein
MPMNNVAFAEVNHIGIHIFERDGALIILQKHGFCARVFGWAVAYVHQETISVVWVDHFRLGQICGNLERNSEFVHINIGVRSNDRTSREIDTFPHEIPAYSAGLCTHSRLEGLERSSRPLSGRRHTLDVVIHIGSDVELEHRHVFLNIIAWLTLVNLFSEFLIGANNIDEFVREVIVHTLIVVHHNGGSDCEWRYRQNRAYHPRRVRVLGVESKNPDGFICHALETAENHLGLNGNILIITTQE